MLAPTVISSRVPVTYGGSMRQTRVRTSLAVTGIVAVGLTLGCGNEGEPGSAGDASPSVTEEPTPEETEFTPEPFEPPPESLLDDLPDDLVLHVDYVVNQIETEGIEPMGPVTTPDALTLQKDTTVRNVEWKVWGPEEAIGIGTLEAIWCFPICMGDNFPVRVTLCDIQDGEFTRYTIEGHLAWEESDIEHLTGVLIGSGGEYDPDDDVGCMDISPEDLAYDDDEEQPLGR